jgi:Sec-independent protein translocase protein TatA
LVGTPEIVLFIVILLFIFGATQLPKLARAARESIEELRKAKH